MLESWRTLFDVCVYTFGLMPAVRGSVPSLLMLQKRLFLPFERLQLRVLQIVGLALELQLLPELIDFLLDQLALQLAVFLLLFQLLVLGLGFLQNRVFLEDHLKMMRESLPAQRI